MTNVNPESDPNETKVEASEGASQAPKSTAESGRSEDEQATGQPGGLPSSEELPAEELPKEELPAETLSNEDLPNQSVGSEEAAGAELPDQEPAAESPVSRASAQEDSANPAEDTVDVANTEPHETSESASEDSTGGSGVCGSESDGANDAEVSDSEQAQKEGQPDGADSAAASQDELKEGNETVSKEEVQQRLDDLWPNVIQTLFAEERPTQQELTDSLESCAEVLKDADLTDLSVAEEFAKIDAEIEKQHQVLLGQEREKMQQVNADISKCLGTYNDMFLKIADLEKSIETVIGTMEENDQFKASPDEMQDLLLNYRKGIEILLRMAARMQSRKKDLVVDPPGLQEQFEKVTAPETFASFADSLTSLTKSFHDLRDVNYRALHDAKDRYMSSRQAVLTNVKGLFGVIDGVDRGFQDAELTKSNFSKFAEHQELAADWLGSYQSLHESVDKFLASIGVESLTVQPGEPYDTNTMDPIATEEHKELPDESVASLSARGLSWDGELIRPIQVVVVKNPQS